MIKYKTSGWSNKIEEVTVLKETAKQIVIVTDHWGRKGERRTAKKSSYENYFDTWDEAKEYLLNQATKRVESLRLQLQSANGELGNIKGMKPPLDNEEKK